LIRWPHALRCAEESPSSAAIAALLGLASVAWLITDLRMGGVDAGPWTDPGPFGFYVSTWVLMMAAMMLPSAVPMLLVLRRLERARSAPAGTTSAFVSYLVVWGASGLVVYAALKVRQAARRS
jgi:predicted metal-binding membrane protein